MNKIRNAHLKSEKKLCLVALSWLLVAVLCMGCNIYCVKEIQQIKNSIVDEIDKESDKESEEFVGNKNQFNGKWVLNAYIETDIWGGYLEKRVETNTLQKKSL